nr:MAG TPA: hypothetical protein [Caudoviricetes sp.]
MSYTIAAYPLTDGRLFYLKSPLKTHRKALFFLKKG